VVPRSETPLGSVTVGLGSETAVAPPNSTNATTTSDKAVELKLIMEVVLEVELHLAHTLILPLLELLRLEEGITKKGPKSDN
jgi:hypothetical protein